MNIICLKILRLNRHKDRMERDEKHHGRIQIMKYKWNMIFICSYWQIPHRLKHFWIVLCTLLSKYQSSQQGMFFFFFPPNNDKKKATKSWYLHCILSLFNSPNVCRCLKLRRWTRLVCGQHFCKIVCLSSYNIWLWVPWQKWSVLCQTASSPLADPSRSCPPLQIPNKINIYLSSYAISYTLWATKNKDANLIVLFVHIIWLWKLRQMKDEIMQLLFTTKSCSILLRLCTHMLQMLLCSIKFSIIFSNYDELKD